VSVGGQSACAIEIGPNGGVWCWGNNAGAAQVNSPLVRDAISVAVGEHSACALDATENVACWGDDTAGELGNATVSQTPSAVPVFADFP
jgi:hypothetical protein